MPAGDSELDALGYDHAHLHSSVSNIIGPLVIAVNFENIRRC